MSIETAAPSILYFGIKKTAKAVVVNKDVKKTFNVIYGFPILEKKFVKIIVILERITDPAKMIREVSASTNSIPYK